MKLMKKIISLSLAASLLIAITACTEQTDSTKASDSAAVESTQAEGTLAQVQKVNDNIHVDQVGYILNDKKIAVINGTAKSFSVVDSKTGKIVLTKAIADKVSDSSSGDTVCYADFSEIKTKGQYYISIPKLGKSYDFKIDDASIFSDVNNKMLKAIYYQRCGLALTAAAAGEYTHEACHKFLGKLYSNETTQLDVSGGWHDAGDYGKYVVPASVTAADLLLAYEFYPESFNKTINIPESSNNTPDVLDEARYGIEWLLKMQDSKSGGVYHKATTRGFPDITAMPDIEVDDIVVMPISTTATADFTAVTAMASRIFKQYDLSFSTKCLKASEKAWKWLEDNESFVAYKNPQDVTTGEYGDDSGEDEKCWAAAELFRATENEKYSKYFVDNFSHNGFGLGWQNVSGYGAIAYMQSVAANADKNTIEDLKKSWLEKADMFVDTAKKDGYLLAMHKMEYYWGSNMNVANHGIHLLIADKLSKNDKYTEAATNCAHYLLGRNTLNQSYITGIGSKLVMQPHHRLSAGDTVKGPIPGFVVGGPNTGLEDDAARKALSGKAPAKCYIDDVNSYSTNEVATYWNSSAIFVFSYLGSKK